MIDSINLPLPRPLYDRLQQIALRSRRSLTDTVATLVTQVESLPSVEEEVNAEVMTLAGFPNEVLVLLAQNSMSISYQSELSSLTDRIQQGLQLNPDKQDRHEYLLDYYQKAVLRRAYCVDILRQRGHDLTELLQPPSEVVI